MIRLSERLQIASPVFGVHLVSTADKKSRAGQDADSRSSRSWDGERTDDGEIIPESGVSAAQIQEVYDAGYQAGLAEAANHRAGEVETSREDFQHASETLKKIMEAVNTAQSEREAETEQMVVRLACSIARKIVCQTVEEDEQMVVRSVQEALRCLNRVSRLTIRVNAEDMDILSAHRPELIAMFDALKGMDIAPDQRIGRGGCIVETESGLVDARLDTRLAGIEEALMNELISEE